MNGGTCEEQAAVGWFKCRCPPDYLGALCQQSMSTASTYTAYPLSIGADFRFEVPGQSSVGLIGGGRGQWLGGTMASAEHERIMGVWGQSPQRGPGAEPLVTGVRGA